MNNSITFENLPKCLTYYRGKEAMYFHPVIVKWEWEGHSNAYYAMYAKFNPRSRTLNLSKVLFWTSGVNMEDTKNVFLQKFTEMRKHINGKTWKGSMPEKLDLPNEKSSPL